jgi:hypothetical protein
MPAPFTRPDWRELKIYPPVDHFPDMDPKDFEALKTRIELKGLITPIALYQDNILDGKNRRNACKHRVRTGIRLDVSGPADEAESPYRAFGRFAQLATKGAGIAHVRRSLVAEFARGLAIWSIVGGEDDDGALFNAKFLQRVENAADVVIAFHQLVAVVADPRLALELLRRQVRHVPHRERQVEEEGLPGALLPPHLGVYRPAAPNWLSPISTPQTRTDNDEKVRETQSFYLMGIVHGHYNRKQNALDATQNDIEELNTGIAIVIPIAKVLDFIDATRARSGS